MKTLVFVLIPDEVPPAEISEFKQRLLEQHRISFDDETPSGKFDYLVGALDRSFDDPAAEGRLPRSICGEYSGNICDRANLPEGAVPGAVVTPDGEWHDLIDCGWKLMDQPPAREAAFARWENRYRELIAKFPDGWVIAIWAHS